MRRFNSSRQGSGVGNMPKQRTHINKTENAALVPCTSGLDPVKSARIYGRVSGLQVEQLKLKEWNGFVELTDECKFGLALLAVDSPYISTNIVVPLKDISIERSVQITLLKDIRQAQIRFNSGGDVCIPMPYLDAFHYKAVAQFIHESRMVKKLISDINERNSVRDRWLPNFIESLREIEDVMNNPAYMPSDLPSLRVSRGRSGAARTIGQYILLAMCDRMVRRIKTGISLKVLLYAISLVSRLSLDGRSSIASGLLTHIALWISEGTCDDCIVKMMRFVRGQPGYEYNLQSDDSFSQYITIEGHENIDIVFGTDCEPRPITGTTGYIRRTSLRPVGGHAFLISPEAGKRICARVQLTPDYPRITIYATLRQYITLKSIIDLHARVLRAHSWDQSVRAFNAWFMERRITLSSDTNDLMDILITDLIEIRKLTPTLRATAAHLICLLMRGTLQREMIANYNARPKTERAHAFLIRFIFFTSPSHTVMQYANMLFDRFINATPEERRLEISFTIENSRHSYAVCPGEEIGEVSRYVRANCGVEDEDLSNSDHESESNLSIGSRESTSYMELPDELVHHPSARTSVRDSLLSHEEADQLISQLGLNEVGREEESDNESLDELPSGLCLDARGDSDLGRIYPNIDSLGSGSSISGLTLTSLNDNHSPF
uniref:Uncharacterized protein n=1 Tax=Hubei lepidoptera virus 5 TaxID=1922907 RepID=A0A1L3KP07_9VIRU|nr:hypothetical protein 3 [Hubei lepidoptera virus 5]